jgi:hypothetical protein
MDRLFCNNGVLRGLVSSLFPVGSSTDGSGSAGSSPLNGSGSDGCKAPLRNPSPTHFEFIQVPLFLFTANATTLK